MAGKLFVNGFVWIAALTQVQYAVQDVRTTSESPIKYHHERGAPAHPRVVNSSYTYMFVSWEPPNDNISDINNYIVDYFKANDRSNVRSHDQKITAGNETKVFLKGLLPGTRYSFFVIANYSSGHMPPSISISYKLPGFGEDNPCQCNYTGTLIDKLSDCERTTGQCTCKNEFTRGISCNECTKRAYWHPKLGCQECHCNQDKTSDGTCYLSPEGLVMCRCLNNHYGMRCAGCHNGFYLVGGIECQPCDCSGNELRTSASKICDDKTGKCLSCGYNTTGNKCNVCKPGFIGSALARNCTYDLHTPYGESVVEVNNNLVIGLTLGIVIVLTVVFVLLAYFKCRRQKKPFSFWTVQLDDDHENVNFSSMMEQDFPYQDSSRPNGVNSSRASSLEKVTRKTGLDGNVYRPVKT